MIVLILTIAHISSMIVTIWRTVTLTILTHMKHYYYHKLEQNNRHNLENMTTFRSNNSADERLKNNSEDNALFLDRTETMKITIND